MGRINKRNHRKTIIIDKSIVYTGSLNIADVHDENVMGQKAWRDIGICARNFDIQALEEAYSRAWRSLSPFRRHKNYITSSIFRLNATRQTRVLYKRELLRSIRKAQKKILIINAYFLPRRSLVRELARAAQRGVYVGIILPGPSDIWIVKMASHSVLLRLLYAGAQIYEYQPKILHAKAVVIDDWAGVGTHNWNHRSFLHDLELEVSIPDPQFVNELTQSWENDIRFCRQVKSSELGRWNIGHKAIAYMAYWLRYWL